MCTKLGLMLRQNDITLINLFLIFGNKSNLDTLIEVVSR